MGGTASTPCSPRWMRCWPRASGDGAIHTMRAPAVSPCVGLHLPRQSWGSKCRHMPWTCSRASDLGH